jgi:hypothetical protein
LAPQVATTASWKLWAPIGTAEPGRAHGPLEAPCSRLAAAQVRRIQVAQPQLRLLVLFVLIVDVETGRPGDGTLFGALPGDGRTGELHDLVRSLQLDTPQPVT